MMLRYVFFSVAILLSTTAGASATIIDHSSIAGVAALPQSTMDAIGQQKWLFTHASVGANMVDGMNDLHSANPTRYQLKVSTAYLTSPLPDPTIPGTVYEINRGNPDWTEKFSLFDTLIDNGYRSPKIDFAMNKLCWIDQNASAATYIASMSSLEAAYPGTSFVYTTMPLSTGEDDSNVLRNQYNSAVRSYCSSNNRLLFDIADIEAYGPSGSPSTFVSAGVTYQKLYSGYAADEGHLNTAGRQQVATGWYAAAASAVVPEPGTVSLLLIGGITLVGATIARRRRA
jgi:hypothetical protein